MILQNEMNSLDWSYVFAPFINVFILIFFIGLMIFAVYKFRYFLVILTIFLFSLIIGIDSISINETPFTPYLQIFFMIFQTLIFIRFTFEVF